MSGRYKFYTKRDALDLISDQFIHTCEWEGSVRFSRNGAAVIEMDNVFDELQKLPHGSTPITVDMEAER